VSEVLRTEQLRKLFGGLVAVNDVEFAVAEGEIVGLIGPNGAGKTTFFNLVSGAMRVSSGRIFFQGREITHAPAYQRAELGIGRTFQIMKPFPRLTVMENLLVGAYLRHPNRHAAVRWAAEVIEMMGLAEFASASARSLTTAGRKRLEVARALTLSPTLLLLDEVVAGLNPVEAEGTVELIRRIRDRGATIIMVEHVMRVIMGLSDRIVVLASGSNIAEGTPQQVATNPDVITAYLGTHEGRDARPQATWSPGTPAGENHSARDDTGPTLALRRVQAAYGDVQVLWDVSLEVRPGELVALIGANGAGKTTTLRTVARLLRVRDGEVQFGTNRLDQMSSHDVVNLGVAMVPEGRQLFNQMTVEENLLTGSSLARTRTLRRTNLDRVYTLFPLLRERRRQEASTLSGGEQQMLAIGRGLMSAPRLLMLDEPSLGLAPTIVEEVFRVVQDIRREGITVLLVEQNVQQALRIADRAYVMESGRIVLEGPGPELLQSAEVRRAYLGI